MEFFFYSVRIETQYFGALALCPILLAIECPNPSTVEQIYTSDITYHLISSRYIIP
jgi:hypothetical protein